MVLFCGAMGPWSEDRARAASGCDGPQVSGSNSVVECQLPKLNVAGSSPVSRSMFSTVYNQHHAKTAPNNGVNGVTTCLGTPKLLRTHA